MHEELLVDRHEELTAEWLRRAVGEDVVAVSVTPIGTGQTGASYGWTSPTQSLPPLRTVS